MNPKFSAYAHPEALVDGEWLQAHLADPDVRVVESNEDILLYDTGHIAGAVHIDWRGDLQDNTVRDYVTPAGFAAICSRHGIMPDTTVIFYGDKSNWWAGYALWAFRLFGHTRVRLLDGGRGKWQADGRPMTRVKPSYPRTTYPVPPKRLDADIRAFYEQTLAHMQARQPLIDVRSPGEFRGEITHMPEYPQEGVLRGGHIP
jgi:thiosulfate/3-mercaptopyruvate sulfurtransferase